MATNGTGRGSGDGGRALTLGLPLLAIAVGLATAFAPAPVLLVMALGIGVALGVVFGTRLLRRPQLGLLVLVALAPFDGLVDIAPDIPFLPAWKEGLVAAVLVATFLGRAGRNAEPETIHWARKASWVPPLVGLAAILCLSLLFRPPVVGLIGLKVALFYALIPVAAMRASLSARERDRLVTILMAGGWITALVGLGQQLVGHERLAEIGYIYNEHIRFSGGLLRSFSTFNTPFAFAFYLSLVLLVCSPVALVDPARLRNRVFLLSTPVLLIALYFTVVRTAVIGLGVGVLVLALLGEPRVRRAMPVLFVGACVVAVVLVASRSGTLSLFSLRERGDTLSNTIGDVFEHPLGHGSGSIGAAAERSDLQLLGREQLLAEAAAGRETLIPDNQYLTWVYVLGIPGLWLFVRLLTGFVATARRATQVATGPDAAFGRGMLAYFVALATWCIFANVLELFPVDLVTWVLVAVVTSLSMQRSAMRPSPATAVAGRAVVRA